MSDLFYTLQNERWARFIGILAGLLTGCLGIIANSDTWQVAAFALIPFLFGFVTERKVWSQKSVDEATFQDF